MGYDPALAAIVSSGQQEQVARDCTIWASDEWEMVGALYFSPLPVRDRGQFTILLVVIRHRVK